jgi:hypothetical protein
MKKQTNVKDFFLSVFENDENRINKTFKLRPAIYKEFQKLCKKRRISVSRAIELFMKFQLINNKADKN